MKDTLSSVRCVDCGYTATYSFVLAADDGQQKALMLLASCPTCRTAGDNRSLRTFQKVPKQVLSDAVNNGLLVVLLR